MAMHVLWGYLQSEEEVTSGANSAVTYTYYWTDLHQFCLAILETWVYPVSSQIFLNAVIDRAPAVDAVTTQCADIWSHRHKWRDDRYCRLMSPVVTPAYEVALVLWYICLINIWYREVCATRCQRRCDRHCVSSSLLSNDAQQSTTNITWPIDDLYDWLSVDRTAEHGGGREMAVSADDFTCRSVELQGAAK